MQHEDKIILRSTYLLSESNCFSTASSTLLLKANRLNPKSLSLKYSCRYKLVTCTRQSQSAESAIMRFSHLIGQHVGRRRAGLQNLDSGLWTGPWTGLWTQLFIKYFLIRILIARQESEVTQQRCLTLLDVVS